MRRQKSCARRDPGSARQRPMSRQTDRTESCAGRSLKLHADRVRPQGPIGAGHREALEHRLQTAETGGDVRGQDHRQSAPARPRATRTNTGLPLISTAASIAGVPGVTGNVSKVSRSPAETDEELTPRASSRASNKYAAPESSWAPSANNAPTSTRSPEMSPTRKKSQVSASLATSFCCSLHCPATYR